MDNSQVVIYDGRKVYGENYPDGPGYGMSGGVFLWNGDSIRLEPGLL